jgi:uncharacterized damage-inducible protein DinB
VFAITELYSFSSDVRRRFLEKLESLPWETVSKNREASHYSMKNIIIHIIDNEDWIVGWVIPGRSSDYKRKKSEEYTSMRAIREHLDEVERNTRAFLGRADEKELQRRVIFALPSGTFDLSVEECLLQSFTEQIYHMGELIALLWQENIEPPKMQWFWNNPRSKQSPAA